MLRRDHMRTSVFSARDTLYARTMRVHPRLGMSGLCAMNRGLGGRVTCPLPFAGEGWRAGCLSDQNTRELASLIMSLSQQMHEQSENHLNSVEKLQNDRCDSSEEIRARSSLHLVTISNNLYERAFLHFSIL